MRRLVAALAFSLALAACAAPTSYMGVPFAPSMAPRPLQALAQRAMSGDKQAQFDLGIALEEGHGTATDPKRALKLYRLAATTTGGTIFVYVPPVKKGGKGSVMPVNSGPVRPGLPEARVRYQALKAKVVGEKG